MRVVVLGNAGSGKSTLARFIARHGAIEHLDLDTVAWEPGQIAMPRAPADARRDVELFCLSRSGWVAEGCYAGLVAVALAWRPRLILLNPGPLQCAANCRSRPWEPQKYATRDEQDARLAGLLDWVAQYYVRDDEMSLAAHRACFDAYQGPKAELTGMPALGPPDPVLVRWLCGVAAKGR